MRYHRIVVLLLLCLYIGTIKSECLGWNIEVDALSRKLCSKQEAQLRMTITNDTISLDSCLYEWYVKTPSNVDFELYSNQRDTIFTFDQVGTYSIYAAAKPNDCTKFLFSTTQNVILLPTQIAGKIHGSEPVCYGHEPDLLSEIESPIGGDGSFTRQWEYNNGSGWTEIYGATAESYQPNSLTENTSYRVKYSSYCGDVYSNEVEIVVRPLATAPKITTNIATICYGESATLQCEVEAQGSNEESFTYQWQESINGHEFNDIKGATELSITTAPLYEKRWYRLLAKSSFSCDVVSSAITEINVFDELLITNHTTSPICYLSSGEISISVSGAGGNYIYQWKESTDNESFYDISGANSSTYNISNKAAGTYFYKVLVAPTNGCQSKHSNVFSIEVYDSLSAGTIVGIDTICYDTQPTILSQTIMPTGGNNQFTYQWQYKTDGAWSDIVNATGTSYQPGALKVTTYFRLIATTSCGQIASNEIEIYVRKNLTAPVITSTPETICYGFAPDVIEITTPSACDPNDSVIYQWQVQTTNGWKNIVGATALTYQPESITDMHQYRVIATSVNGCGSCISNIRTINVYDDLQIVTSGTTPLCYMTRGTISVSATGEGDSYMYQWQETTDGIHFVDLPNTTNSNFYITQPKTGGTYYYRCIVNPLLGCAPDTSAIISVVVYDDVVPGKIAPTGEDTICYGFVPDPITISTPATGGNGQYYYQWLRRSEGNSNFSVIVGATSTSYAPNALFKSTEYVLEVTSACNDSRYTDTVCIHVREQLHAPILKEHLDTICYNTIPEPIIAEMGAKGGIDDSFKYQWQVSNDGVNFSNIIGEIDTVYQPDALLQKQYYRLQATSEKLCGDLFSNVIEQNVYDSLHIIISSPIEPICYMTSAKIDVSVSGGGGNYSYQWQQSSDSIHFNDIPSAIQPVYETEILPNGKYYYRCIVSVNKCDVYSRISSIVTLDVYEQMFAGTITGIDSTCYGYAPAGILSVDTPATGANSIFTYQWQNFVNGHWENVEGQNSTYYQPEILYTDAQYRLKVASVCDTLYTNTIYIRVNPLPQIQPINGSINVCYNQHEVYSIDSLAKGYTYEWYLENGMGELTSNTINTTSINVYWRSPNAKDSLVLSITNDITGCEQEVKLGINICNEQAPERTIIVHKPNSNILVCEENSDLVYQWGYTEKSSMKETIIEDSNRRYVLLPHTFNKELYDYWLTLRNSVSSPCYSRSVYIPENDKIIEPSVTYVSMPTYVQSRVPIVIYNPELESIKCTIFSITGNIVAEYDYGNEYFVDTTLPIHIETGMYIVRVAIGEQVESIKLIAE